MIDAGHLGNVIDVVNQRFERRARDLGHPLARYAVHFHVVDRLAGCFLLLDVSVDRGFLVFLLRIDRLAIVLVVEAGEEIDIDHPAILCDRPQHVVSHVARGAGERAG